MVRRALAISALSLVLAGSAAASTPPLPRADGAPATVAGIPVEIIERAFVSQYNNAYREVGASGLSFVPVLQAFRDDLGFQVNPEGYAAQLNEKDRMLAGIRAEHPRGLRDLPAESAAVLRRYPREELNPFFGVFANAIAATCISAEQAENEGIVKKIVAAKAPAQMHFHLLGWVTHMRESMCIGPAAHEGAARALVKRTQASLAALMPADRIMAIYTLYRAGVQSPAAAADLALILAQDPVENEWEGERSPVFGRRDVVLAAAYVLMRVLAEQTPGPPKEGAAAVVARMYAKNLILENTPLLGATERLKPRPPDPNEWPPQVMRTFKILTQVKVLADSDPRRLGPVSCGCAADPQLQEDLQ